MKAHTDLVRPLLGCRSAPWSLSRCMFQDSKLPCRSALLVLPGSPPPCLRCLVSQDFLSGSPDFGLPHLPRLPQWMLPGSPGPVLWWYWWVALRAMFPPVWNAPSFITSCPPPSPLGAFAVSLSGISFLIFLHLTHLASSSPASSFNETSSERAALSSPAGLLQDFSPRGTQSQVYLYTDLLLVYHLSPPQNVGQCLAQGAPEDLLNACEWHPHSPGP